MKPLTHTFIIVAFTISAVSIIVGWAALTNATLWNSPGMGKAPYGHEPESEPR